MANQRIYLFPEVSTTGTERLTLVDGAVGIDDDETGNARHTPLLTDDLALLFVADELRPLGLVLFQLPDPGIVIVVDADTEELDLGIVLVVSHMLLDIGNLGTAGTTPGGPDINIDKLAKKVGETVLLALQIAEGHIGTWLTCLCGDTRLIDRQEIVKRLLRGRSLE